LEIESTQNAKRSVTVVASNHSSHDGQKPDIKIRDDVYNSASAEKNARAAEFSAIKRGVSRDHVVIADCPNYIKGYRYQLYCEAKATGTRSCVVHVAALEEDCRQWNEARLRAWGRQDEIAQHQTPGEPLLGKDALGSLQPEGHTAVYGDRRVEPVSRSRSSSVDLVQESSPRGDDTMTLKSLYISPRVDDAASRQADVTNGDKQKSAPTSVGYVPTTPVPTPASAPPYSPQTHRSLLMRYEPPSPFSRWDTPLFTVPSTDSHPPYDAIFEALFPLPTKALSKKALSQLSSTSSPASSASNGSSQQPSDVRPNAATVLPQATASSALQMIESTTLLVVRSLLAAARTQGAADGDGGEVNFSITLPSQSTTAQNEATLDTGDKDKDSSNQVTFEMSIPPGTSLSQPQLQRLRRQFTALQRGRIAHGMGYVGASGAPPAVPNSGGNGDSQCGGNDESGGKGASMDAKHCVDRSRAEVAYGFVRFLQSEFVDGT
jgi:tRNA uridine 5-carbamoylmethylation protein Kti12